MTWTIYIIENRLDQLYTGICTDLTRRFKEHSDSGKRCAKALKGKGPLVLKYAAELEGHSSALRAEIWVKKLNKAQKLKLIDGNLALTFEHHLVELSTISTLNQQHSD